MLPAVWESNIALGEPGVTTGLGALLLGWMDGPRALLPWSANIFWLVGLVLLLFGAVRPAILSATVAVIFGLSALGFYQRSMLLEGYDWWLSSLVALDVGTLGVLLWPLRDEIHDV
jgi:hypothetical protein